MEALKITIFFLLAIWYITSIFYNYYDYKRKGLKWNVAEKYRDPRNIFFVGFSTFGLIYVIELILV